VALKKSGLSKLHTEIKTCLSAHVRQKTIRLFNFDYMLQYLCCKWLYIDLICNIFICHNSCRIRIDEDNFHSLLFKRAARLCSCIIKLCGLSDYNRTRTYYKYPFDSFHLWHYLFPPIIFINSSNNISESLGPAFASG